MTDPVRPLWEQGFGGLLGFTVDEVSDEVVRAHAAVRPELTQPMGLVHGGVYASIAESLTSTATALVVVPNGFIVSGQSNNASFLRPITEGTIHVEARRRHRGRTSWIWDVDVSDDDGRLCAVVRMTIAVRPAPEGFVAPWDTRNGDGPS
ncbi:MAG TPA: PaaI family thioesterase [Solirubrobacteraceae bacterium]|nr:PaaI family thioesterase [Solirubrobacteraceae bacterium]